jgi:dCTP deaminase
VDLHLGEEFLYWDIEETTKAFGTIAVDLNSFNYQMLAKKYAKNRPTEADGSVILNPNQFLLSMTREKVGSPISGQLAARVEGRSSLARLGLRIHMTAPTIHAGFIGKIALEIHNAGPFPLRLKPGVAICQLIIEQVSSLPSGASISERFQGQQSAKGA